MRKSITIILLIYLVGCTKTEILRLGNPSNPNLKELSADTTVNGIWDGAGKVLRINDHKIYGTGTLQNWIIDAPLTQWVFDTSINLKNIQVYNQKFSTAWYGTKSTNPDNWWNIQKSMNVCIANHLECFTPGLGVYRYSKTLEAAVINNNSYQQTYLHFSGDASMWDNGYGTTFQYTGTTGSAYNMQLNKGSELNNVVFYGLWKSPGGVDSVYFNTTEANYKDVSGNNLQDTYAGVTVDHHRPLNGSTISGSTGIHIHEVGIGGFSMLLAMSQNGITSNDDIMRVENLHLYDGKYGIVNGQAQEKDMQFRGIYSWGSIFQILSIGKHGKYQAGDYKFDGANIAGRCIQLFDISVAHWYSSNITNWFAENVAQVGTFSGQMPIKISNSVFDLNFSIGKQRVVLNSNTSWTQFENCTLRYYDGQSSDVWVHGYMTWIGLNYFGGGKLVYK